MASIANKRASNRQVYGRSRITNGSALLGDIDGRTIWARRYRDLVAIHVADLGGPDLVSQRELDLVRHGTAIDIELERMAAEWAAAGTSTLESLECFQRSLNSLRRTWQTVGLQRRARDITGPTFRDLWHADQEERRREQQPS